MILVAALTVIFGSIAGVETAVLIVFGIAELVRRRPSTTQSAANVQLDIVHV